MTIPRHSTSHETAVFTYTLTPGSTDPTDRSLSWGWLPAHEQQKATDRGGLNGRSCPWKQVVEPPRPTSEIKGDQIVHTFLKGRRGERRKPHGWCKWWNVRWNNSLLFVCPKLREPAEFQHTTPMCNEYWWQGKRRHGKSKNPNPFALLVSCGSGFPHVPRSWGGHSLK